LAISAAPGTDIAFSVEKIQSYRAFANKIWNAGRFILMNLEKLPQAWRDQLAEALRPVPELGFGPVNSLESLALADRWIFSRLQAVTRKIEEALADYRFHEAAYEVYHFFWHEICDWYLEWVKPEITRPSEGRKVSPAWINLARVFESALHLLHPFMPFITEELWQRLPHEGQASSISLTSFRLVSERAADSVSEKQFELIQDLVVSLRNAKAEMGLQKVKPSAQVGCEDLRWLELFRSHLETILRLSSFQALTFVRDRLEATVPGLRGGPIFTLRVFHEQPVDQVAELARLQKEKRKIEEALAGAMKQLENESFLARAPQEVVRSVTRRRDELADHLRTTLRSIEGLSKIRSV
jgi:valyl-tRNA synthetase